MLCGWEGESFKNSNLNIRRKNEHTKKLRGGGFMGEVQVAGHQPVGRVHRSVQVCTTSVSAVWIRRRGIGASWLSFRLHLGPCTQLEQLCWRRTWELWCGCGRSLCPLVQPPEHETENLTASIPLMICYDWSQGGLWHYKQRYTTLLNSKSVLSFLYPNI